MPQTQIMIRRSSLSPSNGFRFKSLFDKAIISGNDIFIPFSSSVLKPLTLKNRLSDSLLWLATEYDSKKDYDTLGIVPSSFTREDYQHLKEKIRLTFEPPGGFPTGIKINFRYGRKLSSFTGPTVEPLDPVAWRESVIAFKGNPNEDILTLQNNFTDEDKLWVSETIEGTGWEIMFRGNSLTIVK